MLLKACQKNSLLKIVTIPLVVLALSGCTTTVSVSEIEDTCTAQTTQSADFAVRAHCIIQTYKNLPPENRGSYDDLDVYFIDQLALLAEEYKQGKITATQAEAALSRVRVEVESQRRERNYQYDRGRFGVGVGVGHGTGYWGHYGY